MYLQGIPHLVVIYQGKRNFIQEHSNEHQAIIQVDRYKEYLQPYHKQKIFDKLRKIGDKLEEMPSDLPETSFTSHEKIQHPEDMETTIAFHPQTTMESFPQDSDQKNETYFSSHTLEKMRTKPSKTIKCSKCVV